MKKVWFSLGKNAVWFYFKNTLIFVSSKLLVSYVTNDISTQYSETIMCAIYCCWSCVIISILTYHWSFAIFAKSFLHPTRGDIPTCFSKFCFVAKKSLILPFYIGTKRKWQQQLCFETTMCAILGPCKKGHPLVSASVVLLHCHLILVLFVASEVLVTYNTL